MIYLEGCLHCRENATKVTVILTYPDGRASSLRGIRTACLGDESSRVEASVPCLYVCAAEVRYDNGYCNAFNGDCEWCNFICMLCITKINWSARNSIRVRVRVIIMIRANVRVSLG